MDQKYYLLKIELLGVDTALWRRFRVPHNITLDRLHDVIQIVMGWESCHLYEFNIHQSIYAESCDEAPVKRYEASQYRLNEVINKKGQSFAYRYDMDCNWLHLLTLEDDHYKEREYDFVADSYCFDGTGACPPEDIGGSDSFVELCEAVKDPNHLEYDTYIDWVEANFDSDYYDINQVNVDLEKFMLWSRDRVMPWQSL